MQVAALFAAHPFQPMHVSAALGHLAKLHAMAMPPADAQRLAASAVVPRLAGASCTRIRANSVRLKRYLSYQLMGRASFPSCNALSVASRNRTSPYCVRLLQQTTSCAMMSAVRGGAVLDADRAVVLLSNRAEFTGRNIAGCLRSLGKLEGVTGFRMSQARHTATEPLALTLALTLTLISTPTSP